MSATDAARPATQLGLIALSRDATLLETLESVIADDFPLRVVSSEAELAHALVHPDVGVAVLDAASVTSPLAEVAGNLRAQFPELVLVVAGDPADQAAVAKEVASGVVYRFLHKPVSAQRVKLFVDAAMRRHDHEHLVATGTQPVLRPPARRLPGKSIIGALALVAVTATATWFIARPPERAGERVTRATGAAPATPAGFDARLAAARVALARGELVAPAGRSAADLYRAVLAQSPGSIEARDGLEHVISQLCALAEQAISDGSLDDAERYVELARGVDPQHVRVAFLTTRIGQERERAALNEARQAAASGNYDHALAVLQTNGNTPLVADTRREVEQQKLADRVRELLNAADGRLSRDALIEPAQNNARFFIESARALAPLDPRVQQARRDLNERLLAAAGKAVSAGDFGAAERLLQSAEESRAAGAAVLAIRDDIRRAQAGAQADNIARLAQLFGERSKQGRLLEPENDSARYYYNALHQAAPDHPSTLAARTAFGAQLLDAAHTAVSRDDLPAAERLLAAAQQADAAANELESLRHELALARETAARAAAVVPAGVLKRLRYVAPVYPIAAREKDLAGWVDLEFTVRADGSVGDVRAVRADPPGVFEAAATTAIAAWRFQPVQHDGRTIEQRAALRVRFALNQ